MIERVIPTMQRVDLPYTYCGQCENCCDDHLRPLISVQEHPHLMSYTDGWLELEYRGLRLSPCDAEEGSQDLLDRLESLRGAKRELATAYYVCIGLAGWAPWHAAFSFNEEQ